MYSIGSRDRVDELINIPQSDVGAPLPVVLADEYRVLLAYCVAEPDPNWAGTDVNVVSPETDATVAIVTFHRALLHMFGPPNDEAFDSHPLAERGLRPYCAAEVHHSSWLNLFIQMNRVHPHHTDAMFDSVRHFIFAFHDSAFECLAYDFSVSLFHGSMVAATAQMASMLTDR